MEENCSVVTASALLSSDSRGGRRVLLLELIMAKLNPSYHWFLLFCGWIISFLKDLESSLYQGHPRVFISEVLQFKMVLPIDQQDALSSLLFM